MSPATLLSYLQNNIRGFVITSDDQRKQEISTGTLESTKDPESYQVPETQPPHPSLTIHRNLSYSILKYLKDEIVGDKEILELGPCSECCALRSNSFISNPASVHIPIVGRMLILS
ncbi:unnamed protein product [Rhizophagus irregularis]|nr:unnamed protein product [Rhizophagus irregularis]